MRGADAIPTHPACICNSGIIELAIANAQATNPIHTAKVIRLDGLPHGREPNRDDLLSLLNRLRGEEPGYFKKLSVQWKEGTGGLGEYLTEYALVHGELPGRKAVFRNVLVPRSTGPTSESEVDVLMLHETGIYVMESKNYAGWIFGSESQSQWAQTLENGTKERFYNPIIQNRAHVKALAACLGLPLDAFRSYIVFSERCTLRKVPNNTDSYLICQRQHLLKLLRKDVGGRERCFDDQRFDELEASIGRLAAESTDEAKTEHIEQAQRVKAGEVCPRCGGELVRRKGRYGEFMGCSNYPKCRYTRSA